MADRSQFDVVYTAVNAGDFVSGQELCIKVPHAMLKVIVGALEPFIYPDAYAGSDLDRVTSARQIETFIATIAQAVCEPEAVEVIKTVSVSGGIVLEGEDMGQTVTNVYVDDGVLYVEFGPCCIKTYDFTSDLGFKLPPEEEWKEVYIPPESAGYTYTGCAKAIALANVFFEVIDQLTDDASDNRPPWEAMSRLQNRFPTINFGGGDALAAYAGALGVALGGLITEVEDFEFKQSLICAYASILADDDVGVTADEWSSLKGLHNGVVNRTFTILTQPLGWVDAQRLLVFAFSAIGAGDAREITTSVPAQESDDCSCTGNALPGGLFTRSYSFDYSFFNPNTSALRDMPLSGTPTGYPFKALVVDWSGESPGNGEIKLDDDGARYNISDYQAPFSGKFALHDNSSEAIAWLDLYHSDASKFVANDLAAINDGNATVQTLGNNVTVVTAGTMVGLYDPADDV